jgi:outer membrane protein
LYIRHSCFVQAIEFRSLLTISLGAKKARLRARKNSHEAHFSAGGLSIKARKGYKSPTVKFSIRIPKILLTCTAATVLVSLQAEESPGPDQALLIPLEASPTADTGTSVLGNGTSSETASEAVENQQAPKNPPPPLPLESTNLDAIFQSVTGGSTSPLDLNIGELVRMALENNPEIKIQRLQPDLGQTDIRRALGLFDPKFNFRNQYSQSETPQNAQQYIATGGETTQTQLALIDQLTSLQDSLDALLAEIQGNQPQNANSANIPEFTDPRVFSSQEYDMLWQLGGLTPMGTEYSLNFNQLQARNDINIQTPPSLFYPEYTSIFSISLTQPLLKDFGPAANLAGLRVARIQKKIGWYDWQKQIIRSLSEALYRYFDLVFAYENLRVRKEAVKASLLLERQNIQRVQNGKMRPSDVWEAQASLSNNIDLALRAMNLYVESQNSLKALIFNDQMAARGDIGRIIPATSLEMPLIKIQRFEFIQDAIAYRPEYLQIVSKAEQEGIRVRYARNQAYPTVDFQSSFGLTGLEGEYGSSFGNAFSGQGTAFSVGVLVSIPLGNIEGKANLDAAKLREKQAKIAIQKAITELSLEVDTSISLLETGRQQVIAARNTATAALNTVVAEEKLLEEGKSTTFEVVRLQNNASESRSRELASIASYRKNIVRLAVARGKLLEELGISLEKEAIKSAAPGKRKPPQLPQSMKLQ